MLSPGAMDTDYAIDLASVFDVIDQAEVVTFRFVTLHRRLLFDARHNETDGPFLKLVPRATSLEERFKAIKQLRPRFRIPDKITAIWWPKYAHSLVDSGVWDRILGRIAKAGYPQIAERAEDILRDLFQQERAETYNAITGTGYHTLWQAPC